MRAQIDRTLPPFSVQRYVAIWLLGMIPLALVLFLLLRPAAGNPPLNAAVITPTVATGGAATGGAATSAPAALHDCQAPAEAGKYMVIDTVKGCIVARLYTDPSANVGKVIANFEEKANSGFFNGLVFHRVEDWVIQGGDPEGTGAGGGKMPAEYNKLPFKTGALGVARGPDKAQDSDSQFFITKSPADYLNGEYTNFGEVVTGMDVVNQIAIGDKMTKVGVVQK